MNIVINKPKLKSQIVKTNRIGSRIISEEKITYKELDFNGCLRSIIVEDEMFTNYVSSYDKKIYKELKEIFDDIYWGKAKIEEKFKLLNNEDDPEKEQTKRLNRIIKKGNYLEKIPSLMKLVPKHPKTDKTLEPVRVYIYYNVISETFELYLIDLYHLGIDGMNYNIQNGRYDLKSRYHVNEKNKKCISRMADDYI